MATFQSQNDRPRRQNRWAALQRVLTILIALSLVGIASLLLIIGQTWYSRNVASHQPARPPVVAVSPTPSPTPTAAPSPTPTPSPAPTPTPSPTPVPPPSPTPTPPLPPGVLKYPLYSGNPQLPEIALSFDDGPNPPYTSQVLALLQQYGVNATFFVIGSRATIYPALVQQEFRQGNVVGNHTWAHPELIYLSSDAVRSQLQSASNEIRSLTGRTPTLFRPPYAEFNSTIQYIAGYLGLSTVLWSVDPKDWSRPGTPVIIKRVLDSVHNGSIILMHDGGGDRSQTVAALPTIITTLKQRGFQFVTLPRMIQDLPPQRTAPSQVDPDQLSFEGDFNSSLSTTTLWSYSADRRNDCFPTNENSIIREKPRESDRIKTNLGGVSIAKTLLYELSR